MTAIAPGQKPSEPKERLPRGKPDYQQRLPSILPAPTPEWLDEGDKLGILRRIQEHLTRRTRADSSTPGDV
jgi:hypothetical protein